MVKKKKIKVEKTLNERWSHCKWQTKDYVKSSSLLPKQWKLLQKMSKNQLFRNSRN